MRDNFDLKKFITEGSLLKDELKVGEYYDVYFKEKPTWKWFRGLKLKSIGDDNLVFRAEIGYGWDVPVKKQEFLDNGWVKPSIPK